MARRIMRSSLMGAWSGWWRRRSDHRENCRRETIRQLDKIFAPVLDKLGYSGRACAETGVPVPGTLVNLDD